MLKRNFLVTFAALLLLCSGVSVSAQTIQEGLSMGPSARPFGTTDDVIIDDELFEYDAQLWAPYDITRMNGQPDRQSGFYSELGFSYMSISGPEAVPGQDPRNFESIDNWSWARDFEIGYASERGSGWSLGWLDLEGTSFLGDTEFDFNQSGGQFANPRVLRTEYDRISVRRQFRQAVSTGGWIEPYFGVDYINVTDNTHQDVAARFSQQTRNSAIGAAIGTKYYRQYGRYTVGGTLGLAGYYNSQTYSATTIIVTGTTFTNRDDDFVPMLDLGGQIRYAVTRDISIRAGVELNYAWQGIARVDTRTAGINPYFTLTGGVTPGLPNQVFDQDFIAAGFNFGVDWRR